ncbi:MAG: S8 family serine peptidase [Chloroflexi bacterium]|nr:S8 family serine peptidase [Chloroflexota bacterium]
MQHNATAVGRRTRRSGPRGREDVGPSPVDDRAVLPGADQLRIRAARGPWRVVVLLALLLLGALAGPTAAAPLPAEPLVVSLRRGASPSEVASLWAAAGARPIEDLAPLRAVRVVPRDSGTSTAQLLSGLQSSPLVRSVERDGTQRMSVVPNDPSYAALQWNLRRISAEQAWDLRPSAPDIVVAVLDTGVDYEHPDLRANLLLDEGFDFTSGTPLARDDESHGTAVAGILGAVGNNGEGVTGVAWKIKILPIKVLNSLGRGSNSTLARAITYAVDRGARILNISSTSTDYSPLLEQAVAYARERDVVVVAAAGNSGDQGNQPTYPAALPGVLAVGAIDEADRVPSFSQRGDYVGLLAPGVDVPSTSWAGAGRGAYASYSGTSIAAPHVAGVAALLWSMRPDLPSGDIIAAIQATVDPIAPSLMPAGGLAPGAGVVNAGRAVARLRLGVPPTRVLDPQPPLAVAEPPALPAEGRRTLFAEGSTQTPFETWFALFNPSLRPASATLTFSTVSGRQVRSTVALAPGARTTLRANDLLPGEEFSTQVQADGPVFAERSTFFGHDGHSSSGSRDAARSWYLAEGSTAPPFDTWILLLNPSPAPAQVRLRLMLENGQVVEQRETVPPSGRRSVYANLVVPNQAGFSTQIDADQPIVVERAMYFDAGAGGHDTLGTRVPSRTWLIPNGIARAGFDTWVLIQNPNDVPATVNVTLMGDDGVAVVQPLLVRPRARASLLTNVVTRRETFGIRVESDQPVVAERAVYFAGSTAGFVSVGQPAAAAEWFFADGSTAGSFLEQLSLFNPQGQAANVEVDIYRQDGAAVPPRRLRLAPTSARTVDVNPWVVDGVASLRVISDRPILAERVEYFARPTGLGASASLGQTR